MARLVHLIATLAVLAAALLVHGAAAGSAVHLHMKRNTPGFNSVLAPNETIYIAIDYRSDIPLRLKARAHRDGASVDEGQRMNPSVLHPAGKGTGLVWVGFSNPATVDEIHVTAYDDNWKPVARQILPARLSWAGNGVVAARPPAWVEALRAEEKRLAVESGAHGDSPFATLFSIVLGFAAIAALPAYLILQLRAVVRLSGRWRWVAVAPLLVMLPAALHASIAFTQQSNLWPIMLILASPLGVIYLSVVLWTQRGAVVSWR